MSRRIGLLFLILGSLLNASIAIAQNPHTWGTSDSGFLPAAVAAQPLLTVGPTAVWTSASYSTGGVAMRNRRVGEIQISGVTPPTQAAYLYWAVLLNTSTPSKSLLNAISNINLTREYPPGPPVSADITGTLLNIGGDPCWGSTGAWVFRGAVPTSIAVGNGVYKLVLWEAATGLTDGEDPWDGNRVFPLFEGASLVLIGTGEATVGLLDGQAGTTFIANAGYSATYTLPTPITGSNIVLFDNFGYDGQIGRSRTITSSNETTTVEGMPSTVTVLVAGPGGETGDSDWDGSSGWPLPQLWDDTGHDISNAFLPGDTAVVVTYGGNSSDCVGTVGAVLSVE
jgi:hypothetical protein